MRPTVVVSVPVHGDQKEYLEASCDVTYLSRDQIGCRETILAAVENAQGFLADFRIKIDDEFLDRGKRLKVVSVNAVGINNVDVPAATRRGVLVYNTPGVLDSAVSDLCVGLILCLGRNILNADRFVRSGAWTNGPMPLTRDFSRKTLGLLGFGRIGQMVARKAKVFGFEVIFHDPFAKLTPDLDFVRHVDRSTIFREADFLSIHMPLTEQTNKSVGVSELASMKATSFLINTARGQIVDQDALVAALQNRQIGGAALDCMEQEPLSPNNALAQLDNVILQPHVGSATIETRQAMLELAVENLVGSLNASSYGSPVN